MTRHARFLLLAALGCGGAAPPAPVTEAPVHTCSPGYSPPATEPPIEVREKLDGSLANRIQIAPPCELLVVSVTYTGDRSALVAAGLETGYDSGGVVSGRIESRRVLDLATLPQVTRVELQPDVQPN